MDIREKLGKELIFFDGGLGTLLQKNGLKAGELPELMNFSAPEVLVKIHADYINAGAQIITANTFGANRYKLEGSGVSVKEVAQAAINNVKKAIALTKKQAYVAYDIGPLGKMLRPVGELSFDEAYEAYKEIVLAAQGAELFALETFTDLYEVKAAVLAVKENSDLPLTVTLAFDENGKLLTGGDIPSAVALLEGLGVDAIGFNCGLGPETMLELLPELTSCCSVPVVINPNAGLPVVENGQTVFKITPDDFAKTMVEIVKSGAHLVGGCCGTTPAHIERTVALCKDIKLTPITDKGLTVVSSYTHAVTFGDKPVIIGERINPTGKARFKQALRESDFEYIFKEGIAQEESGAHILDVNVGLPEIDEPSVMETTVTGLQAITDLPLQIDTTNIAALERAMRIYNGKPMINSVNAKQEVMDAVFPLVKKYGGLLVCLTLDEDGIPQTAEGRIALARRMINEAKKYGIEKKNLIVDTLTMSVSTGSDNAKITLDALRGVRERFGVNTVLGVSNISFGLPQRERITSSFFTLALYEGLSAGIVNPMSESLMSAYYSFCALCEKDDKCLSYIEKYSGAQSAPVAQTKTELSLYDSIIKGMAQSASEATKKLLTERESLDIINNELIPALDVVGKGFEEKTLFLPQLLMSAEAASVAFETIRKTLEKNGQASEKKSPILIATVKGDVHDIGKNIVKVLLSNYGFEVIDLGKDVAPEKIVQTAIDKKIRLVALSALMTTTVVNMEETIKQLKKSVPGVITMVGGAVLTQEYADMIGADFYSKDAMGAVRFANELYEKGEI